MVINAILTYLKYDVATTTRTVFEIPTKFPKITICNFNMFTTEFSLELLKNLSKSKSKEGTNIFNRDEVKDIPYSQIIPKVSNIHKYAVSIVNSKNFSDDLRKKLGHTLKQILFNCKFDSIPCYPENFTWEFHPNYGNCFSFNSDLNSTVTKESKIAGPLNGLQLQLFVNVHENLSEFYYSYTENGIYTFNALGAVILIDNSTNMIDHNYNGGIKVASGFHTDISISRSFTFNLPKPYSNCDLDNNKNDYESRSNEDLVYLFVNHSNHNMAYTQQSCIIQCYQFNTIKRCNCSHPFYASLFEDRVCESNNPKDVSCYQQSWIIFNKDENFIEKNCLPLCPLECNQTYFEAKLTNLRLTGWNYYLNLINKYLSPLFISTQISRDTAINSFVSLNIFYDSLSYTLISERPQIDFISLLGNIGGNLGLFLGVSFFSLCELVVAFIEILCIKKIIVPVIRL